MFGPALENQLRPHGGSPYGISHKLRVLDFGWLDRHPPGGHFATLYTHIDDFVESLPAGTLESRRLPGSGAGPSPADHPLDAWNGAGAGMLC